MLSSMNMRQINHWQCRNSESLRLVSKHLLVVGASHHESHNVRVIKSQYRAIDCNGEWQYDV